jgi:hypothetical protein
MIVGSTRLTILQVLKLPLVSWLQKTAALTLVAIATTSINSINFYLIDLSIIENELDILGTRKFSDHSKIALINTAFAEHGEEISTVLSSVTFVPLTSTEGNQVRVGVNYTTLYTTLIENTINVVMKVYAPNTTAIKSTSFPNGLMANSSGTAEIKTTILGNSTQNVTLA